MQERDTARMTQVRGWRTPEFVLVVVMLTVLTILVVAVLLVPLNVPQGDTTTMADLLEYRKNILSLILTAFGAWVGAGAAYFFGRESLREAATSLLAMREPSPQERLRKTRIREIPPRPLDWVVRVGDNLGTVTDKLRAEPWRWFIPIVKDDGSIETVIEEEAIWRSVDAKIKEKSSIATETAYGEIMQMTVQDVLKYVAETEGLGRFKDCYVLISLDKSAGDVYELMQNKGVALAIVTDERGRPTHFITTGDIREVLLQTS